MTFPSSSSPLVSMAKAKTLRRQSSLAPSRAINVAAPTEDLGCESTSMLMDISLGQLDFTSPERGGEVVIDVPAAPALRDLMSNDLDLDALSTDDLERLAWEAQEEERQLRSRLQQGNSEDDKDGSRENIDWQRNLPTGLDDPMRNITMRSPRRSARRTVSPSKVRDMAAQEQDSKPAPIQSVRHSKSVTFGRIDEYEISWRSDVASENQQPDVRAEKSPIGPVKKQAGTSSISMTTPVLAVAANRVFRRLEEEDVNKPKSRTTVAKATKKRRSSCASSPLKDSGIRVSKLPLHRPGQHHAIVESAKPVGQDKVVAARKRVAAGPTRRPSSRAPVAAVPLPSGFRITSTGTLVSKTAPKAPAMTVSRTKTAPRAAASDGVPRANPVPEWLKRRKEQLAEEELERLAQQCERVRLLELKKGKKERTMATPAAPASRQSTLRRSASHGFVSAVDRRLAERAEWEAQRKAREAILEQERERARLQCKEEEEHEYRLERQRTVVHANPLPDWLHTTIRQ